MKKITVISGIVLAILSISIFLISKKSKQKYPTSTNGSEQTIIGFSATLTEPPKQIEYTNDYYLSFNNVQAEEKRNQSELDVFTDGGVLITLLPTNKKVKSGDKIKVRVHRDFVTTCSIPPQLAGNSVISVFLFHNSV